VADGASTTIASLALSIDESFGYWFDFGDDWWHQISVVAILEETAKPNGEKAAKGKYPRITERVGASPPQYE
jgi:Plasmid pRiA4b ORF-3-like protein